jgi:hypothetical protein
MSNVIVLALKNRSDCIGSGLRKEQLESGSRCLTVPALGDSHQSIMGKITQIKFGPSR